MASRVDSAEHGWQIAKVRWLGLDLGERTIGVAVSDEGALLASPLKTVQRHGGKRDLDALDEVMREYQCRNVVLGLPLTMEGKEEASARAARRFGEQLEQGLGCRVEYLDERFTTVQAERALLEADMRRSRRKQVIDKVAAAIILQCFLDRMHEGAG